MTYFNDDQRSYMESLARIPPEGRCWCGWYRLGECQYCRPDKSSADKLAARCQACGNTPHEYGDRVIHRRDCVEQGAPDEP